MPTAHINCYCLSYDKRNQTYQLQNFHSISSPPYISFDNRGLAYGDGFFSTMGVYQGHILWADYHHKRLLSHAQVLQLQLDSTQVITILANLAQQIKEGIIKIIITRQPQSVRGYGYNINDNVDNIYATDEKYKDISNDVENNVEIFIKTMPMAMSAYHNVTKPVTNKDEKRDMQAMSDGQSSYLSHMAIKLPLSTLFLTQLQTLLPTQPIGQAICLQSKIACLPKPLVGLKSLNQLDSVLVAGELEQAKYLNPKIVEGLVSDVSDSIGHNWVEGVSSNLFYQLANGYINDYTNVGKNPEDYYPWYTPPIDRSGVNGIMRQVVMDKLAKSGQPVIERKLNDKDLPYLSALFFCNAVRGIIPISNLFLPIDSC